MIGELDSTGNISKKYFYGKDMISDNSGNNYVYDIHGSVTNVLNSSGTKTGTYEYNAFGDVEKVTGSTAQPWQYCGEYKDGETGLIYLRNRYYDPEMGRFISEDPIRSGGNWYSYAGQNPVMFWDPLGLMKTSDVLFNYMNNNVLDYNWHLNGGKTKASLEQLNRNTIEMFFNVLFEEESISGSVYKLPRYYTKASPSYKDVCWAVCEVFVKNFNNSNITTDEFNNQIDEMVERVKEHEGLKNGEGYYFNSLSGSTKYSPSFNTIVNMLDESNGPIYASIVERTDSFGGSVQNHAVVIFGAYQYKGVKHVLYYDPNYGIAESTYSDSEMKLNGKKLEHISKVDKDNFD